MSYDEADLSTRRLEVESVACRTVACVAPFIGLIEFELGAWRRLATDLDLSLLDSMIEKVTLNDCIPVADRLLDGTVRGRVIVPISDN